MNEKEPIKVRLSTVILFFIIFLLIIAVIFMCFYFKDSHYISENSQAQNNSNVSTNIFSGNNLNNTQSSQTENIIESNNSNPVSLSIDSAEIKKLYNYIMKTNANEELLVYRNAKVTLNDLNNQLRLITVFQNVNEDDASKVNSQTDETGMTATHTYYSKDTIENIAKMIFGDNVQITHEDCWSDFGYTRNFENDEYDCFAYQGGGSFLWENSTSKLVKAEQVGDEIYIYDNYVHIYGDENSSNYDIYDSSDKSLKIAKNLSYEQIFNNSTYPDIDFNNLQKLTNNMIKTYKHTFKKASNGSYYWYSTEPIQ